MKHHYNIRPFKCIICEQSFYRNSILKLHMYTHSGTNPYMCFYPQCNIGFYEESQLKHHMKKTHYKRQSKLTFDNMFKNHMNANRKKINLSLVKRNLKIIQQMRAKLNMQTSTNIKQLKIENNEDSSNQQYRKQLEASSFDISGSSQRNARSSSRLQKKRVLEDLKTVKLCETDLNSKKQSTKSHLAKQIKNSVQKINDLLK